MEPFGFGLHHTAALCITQSAAVGVCAERLMTNAPRKLRNLQRWIVEVSTEQSFFEPGLRRLSMHFQADIPV